MYLFNILEKNNDIKKNVSNFQIFFVRIVSLFEIFNY